MRTHPRARALVSTLVAGLALSVATAAPAAAAPVKLGGGGTTLRLAPSTARALASLHVAVAPIGPAKAGSSGIRFPITGGLFNAKTARGHINHSGGLRLSSGATKLRLTAFDIRLARNATLSAKVNGGSRATIIRLGLGKAKIARSGLGYRVSGVVVRLSATGAAALNATFHVKAFAAGLKLGTATVLASPARIVLRGGATELALDAGAGAALKSLGVTPGLVGPAKATKSGAFAFPITGGSVNATSLAGRITHSGGISLTKGATVVKLTRFTIDTRAKQLTALVNGKGRVAILDLDLSAPVVKVSGRHVRVGNVPAKLTAGAAGALNAAFGTTAFTAGLKLGVATVRGLAA